MAYTLAYKDRFKRVAESLITSDTSNSVAFASLPDDEPTRLSVEWTGKQFTKLLSAVITGADLMFPNEANEIIWQLVKAVHQLQELGGDDTSGCIEYLPSVPFVKFFPDNPYVSGDKSVGWNKEAWFYWSDFDTLFPDWLDNWLNGYLGELLGYLPTDVLFNIESVPSNPIDLILNGGMFLPKIEIKFTGTGVVELGLLSFPLGGKAVIELDQEPNIIDILTGGIIDPDAFIVELNRDLVSFPPDEYPINNIELKVETGGVHTLYIVFIPTLNDDLLPVGFGGGIRSIELCGFEESPMGGIQNVVFEDCTLKVLVDGVLEPVANFDEIYDCIGAMMATQAEIKQAIIDAAEQLAAQMLAGETENMKQSFSYSKDTGEKVFTGSLSTDDPATPDYDEALASLMGGAISVAKAIELLLDKVDAYFGATNGMSPVTAEAYAATGIKLYFPCDETAMDNAINAYYNYRAVNNRILFDTSATFQQYLFCKGINAQGFGRWLVDLSGYTDQKQTIVSMLVNALLPEFFTSYSEKGQELPSGSYADAGCVPSPIEVINILLLNVDYYSNTAFKAGHRLLMTAEHYFTDANGSIQDYWWTDPYNAVPANHIAGTSMQLGTGITKPTVNAVPYRLDHKYQFTIDTVSAGSLQVKLPLSSLVAPFTPSNPSTGIKLTIEDLGEYLP